MSRIPAASSIVLTLGLAACDAPPAVDAGRYDVELSGAASSCPVNQPVLYDAGSPVWICPLGSFEDDLLYVERAEDLPYLRCPDLTALATRTWDVERSGDSYRIDDLDSGDVLDGWADGEVITADGGLTVYSAIDVGGADWSAEIWPAADDVVTGRLEMTIPIAPGGDPCTVAFDVTGAREPD